jgi:hypothetical protein
MIDTLEIKGKWWIPGREEKITGILTFSQEKGGILELFETFEKDLFSFSTHDIILGDTMSGKITLYKTTTLQQKSTGIITINLYEPRVIFIGNHFSNINDLLFSSVTFNLYNLFNWFNNSGFEHENNSNSSSNLTIKYLQPRGNTFSISDTFKIDINFVLPHSYYGINNEISLSEECDISFIYSNNPSFEDILSDVTTFQQFITLLTFEQSYPTSIRFKNSDSKSITCYYSNTYYNSRYVLKYPGKHLITYKDIQDKFEDILINWFTNFVLFEPSFQLLLLSFRDFHNYDNDRFLAILRGLESYHRRTSKETKFTNEVFQQNKDYIIDVVKWEGKNKFWLEETLKFANELSLRTRLKMIITKNNNHFTTSTIPNINEFVGIVVNHRNYLIHYSQELEEHQINSTNLSKYTKIATGLLICSLLEQVGIEQSYYTEKLLNLLRL